jgi:CheY-like chemotaxis protein
MKTILVVDDEHALLETLTELLEELGYRVVSAVNGRDGLKQLENEPPDLLLVDYMMPIADGRWLIERARQKPGFTSMPIILMSAAARRSAGASLDQVVFLSKPFELGTLIGTIERLIGNP